MAHRSAPWHSRYARWFSARPQTVVVQPTTFCNLDCTYCYLPHRRLVREMSPEIAGAVARSVTALTNGASPWESFGTAESRWLSDCVSSPPCSHCSKTCAKQEPSTTTCRRTPL